MINQSFATVYTTRDYPKFKTLKGNRRINIKHLQKLKSSIMKRLLVTVIVVNEKFEVIDGQHRLIVMKELDLSVNYIMVEGYGLKECNILNTDTQVWTPIDYLNSYIDLGYEDYIKVSEFSEKYSFLSLKLCQILLTGGQVTGYSDIFNNGEFEIVNYEKACYIADKMLDFQGFIPFKSQNFLLALFSLITNKQYYQDRMLQKISFQSSKIVTQQTLKQYKNTLNEVYNYRARSNDQVYFL